MQDFQSHLNTIRWQEFALFLTAVTGIDLNPSCVTYWPWDLGNVDVTSLSLSFLIYLTGDKNSSYFLDFCEE